MFNLADDPWIPVARNGSVDLVSLRVALTNAQDIDALQPPTPVAVPALLRLLLAVVYRALQGPASSVDAASLLESGHFSAERINDYLDRWRHRFELLDESKPFLQFADSEDKVSSITRLAVESATGTNKLLFDHSIDSRPPSYSFAQAAQLLVARQATAIPEGAGYSPSPAGGVAFVMPQGKNLFETLVLNLVPYLEDENEEDAPSWESEPPTSAEVKASRSRGPHGITDRYSWLSRIVKLLPSEHGTVSEVHYAAGLKFESGMSLDPMVAYRMDAKRGLLPLSFHPSKDFWRDFPVLLPAPADAAYRPPQTVEHAYRLYSQLNRTEPIRLLVAGLRNDKAKVEFWRSITFHVPFELFDSETAQAELERLMDLADESGRMLYGATMRLAKNLLTAGDREPLPADITRLARSFPASPHYWTQLEVRFPALLARFGAAEFEEVARWWRKELRGAVGEAWELARLSAGNSVRAWRAVANSGQLLGAQLRKLREVEAA